MSNRLDLLFFLGRPFSPLYGLAMKVRELLYARDLFHRHTLPVPVISVGNLVLGGSGKTPTVRYLAGFLQAHGYRPAIISRGYHGTARDEVNVVADGGQILLGPEQAGDEPYMLARSLPGVPVLTGRRRIHPSRWAVEHLQADILLLDDGFQHLAVNRNIDLVLFDGSVLAGNSRIFPGGVLREPISALHRCHAFILTGITEKNREKAELFGKLLQSRFPDKAVFTSCLEQQLKNPKDAAPAPTQGLGDKVFFAFCGIANPVRFEDSLKALGIPMAGFLALADHVEYRQSLIDDICAQARAGRATHLVTTEKDYVKIERLKVALPLEILEIRASKEKAFDAFILAALGNTR